MYSIHFIGFIKTVYDAFRFLEGLFATVSQISQVNPRVGVRVVLFRIIYKRGVCTRSAMFADHMCIVIIDFKETIVTPNNNGNQSSIIYAAVVIQ